MVELAFEWTQIVVQCQLQTTVIFVTWNFFQFWWIPNNYSRTMIWYFVLFWGWGTDDPIRSRTFMNASSRFRWQTNTIINKTLISKTTLVQYAFALKEMQMYHHNKHLKLIKGMSHTARAPMSVTMVCWRPDFGDRFILSITFSWCWCPIDNRRLLSSLNDRSPISQTGYWCFTDI